MHAKLTLVDEPQPKPKRPKFTQKVLKSAKGIRRKIGRFLSPRLLTGLSILAIGSWGVSKISEKIEKQNAIEARETQLFQNEGRQSLAAQGYTVLGASEYEHVCGCKGPSNNKLKFPKDFEKAAIFTVERNDSISDIGFVREKISETGYIANRFTPAHFIQFKSAARPK